MAISPEETLKLSAEDLKAVDLYEKEIDIALAARTTDAVQVEFAAIKRSIIAEIEKRYRTAGWQVLATEEERTASNLQTKAVTVFRFIPASKL